MDEDKLEQIFKTQVLVALSFSKFLTKHVCFSNNKNRKESIDFRQQYSISFITRHANLLLRLDVDQEIIIFL